MLRSASFYRGVFLAFILALMAQISASVFHFNTLFFAILYGMILGNTFYPKYADAYQSGMVFCQKTLLRLAIVFYGFNLNLKAMNDWSGGAMFALDGVMVGSTFLLACWLGKRFFGLDRDSSMLIGAGASICGAAAVLGAQSVIRAEEHQVTIAVATVVLFGTLSLVLLPTLYGLGWIPFSKEIFGIYVGAVVHEVAQVVAIGGLIGEPTASLAILSKMVRVLMLVPFLSLLAYFLKHIRGQKVPFPYFALGFLATVLINYFTPDGAWKRFIIQLDQFAMAMAMVALGLSTQFKSMKRFGWQPFLLAGALWLWLLLGGGVLTWFWLC